MKDCGGMAERLKAAVLKTAEARASVGSNPTPSARLGGDTPPTLGGDTPQRTTRNRNVPLGSVPLWTPWECPRRTGEVAESAEGNRLLSGWTGQPVRGVRPLESGFSHLRDFQSRSFGQLGPLSVFRTCRCGFPDLRSAKIVAEREGFAR